MSTVRPKILTRVNVPTGGYDVRFIVSVGGSLDTDIDFTIPAGDYYVAGDNSTADFLRVMQDALDTALNAGAGATYRQTIFWIDSDHKVNIGFDGSAYTAGTPRDVSLEWTTNDGATVAAILGFDGSADDTSLSSASPVFTGDWHHAYGWYADTKANLVELLDEDIPVTNTLQSYTLNGNVVTQRIGARFRNQLTLDHIERVKAMSRGVAYTAAPVYQYERNEGLECWWYEARNGTPFRVYRGSDLTTSVANLTGTSTSATTTTLTDTAKTFDTEPQRWAGALISKDFGANISGGKQRWTIASNTADTLTVDNASESGLAVDNNTTTYYLHDHRFEQYVIDAQQMPEFALQALEFIELYSIQIPLLRHVA